MNKKQLFNKVAPPENVIFIQGIGVYRVTYRNDSQLRFSSTLVGVLEKIEKDGKMAFNIVMVENGRSLTMAEFEKFRRKTWPMKHETNSNPKNKTLNVQSSSAKSIGGL